MLESSLLMPDDPRRQPRHYYAALDLFAEGIMSARLTSTADQSRPIPLLPRRCTEWHVRYRSLDRLDEAI